MTAPCQTSKNKVESKSSDHARITKVFLNLTGDSKQAQRLWTLLSFELEDAGVAVVNSESSADAIISGEVTQAVQHNSLSLGLISAETTIGSHKESLLSCEGLSTGDGELFNGSAKTFLQKIRDQHASARTFSLESSSDTAASQVFVEELRSAAKSLGFTETEAQNAEVTCDVKLSRAKIPLNEKVLEYKIEVQSASGYSSRYSGTISVSAELGGQPPKACPERVADLDWVSSWDSLFALARQITKDIRKNNATALSQSEVISR